MRLLSLSEASIQLRTGLPKLLRNEVVSERECQSITALQVRRRAGSPIRHHFGVHLQLSSIVLCLLISVRVILALRQLRPASSIALPLPHRVSAIHRVELPASLAPFAAEPSRQHPILWHVILRVPAMSCHLTVAQL